MTSPKKILYIGLDPLTPNLLHRNDLKIVGISELEYFYNVSLNPINLITRIVYQFHRDSNNKVMKKSLYILWRPLRYFLSYPFNRYSNYLDTLFKNDFKIINTSNNDSLIEFIKENGIDLIVVNSWSIIDNKVIDSTKNGAVNIHPSKLPQYKGALPTLWSLKNKDSESALTYQVIGTGIDNGDIIDQFIFPITEKDDWYSMEEKISNILVISAYKTIYNFLMGNIHKKKQEGITSFTGKYSQYMNILFHEESGNDIFNKINLYPYIEPYVYCFACFNNRKIEFKRMSISNLIPNKSKGVFEIKWFKLNVHTMDKVLSARLFIDISFLNSVILILSHKKQFTI